jgi:hypothetical protein
MTPLETIKPRLPLIFRDIHTKLKEDAEVTTLLSEDEVALLVEGLKKLTQTQIVGAALKSKKTLKSMDLSDL